MFKTNHKPKHSAEFFSFMNQSHSISYRQIDKQIPPVLIILMFNVIIFWKKIRNWLVIPESRTLNSFSEVMQCNSTSSKSPQFELSVFPITRPIVKEISEICSLIDVSMSCMFKKKKTFWSLFMNGVQLPQGYSHFEGAVYFLPFSSQKFLVLILSTS